MLIGGSADRAAQVLEVDHDRQMVKIQREGGKHELSFHQLDVAFGAKLLWVMRETG